MRKKSIGGSRIVVMPVFINLFFYQAALPVTSVTVFASGYSLTMLLRPHTHTRNTGSNISDHIGCCCLLSAPRGHTYAFTVVPPERLPPPPLQALNLPYLPSLISEKRPPPPHPPTDTMHFPPIAPHAEGRHSRSHGRSPLILLSYPEPASSCARPSSCHRLFLCTTASLLISLPPRHPMATSCLTFSE